MSKRNVLLVAALMLAACGGASGDDAGTTAADAPTDTSTATGASTTDAPAATTITTAAPATTAPPAPSGEGGGGDPMMVPAGESQVSADGSALTPQSLLRCIPFSESDENLDLQVIGDGFVLFVYVNQAGSLPSHEVSIQGSAVGDGESMGVFSGRVSEAPDGSWYVEFDQPPLDGPPLEWSADRVSGAMTLEDAFDQADPIEVSFDVPVPPDVHDCSL
ncbi:MAG TPA: hypothetical protein VLB85_15970 [Acidimicrobiia bacterium]|nr:hypothetical protein [Acidimicrobiia bacterium]